MRRRSRTLALSSLLGAFAGASGLAGCGLFTDVDWDRVEVESEGGVLSDGAPAPGQEAGAGAKDTGADANKDGGKDTGTSPGSEASTGDSGPVVTCTQPMVACVVGCCAASAANPGLPLTVSASEGNTCATTTTGAVYCWGVNTTGELGRGTGNESLVPLDAYNMPAGAKSVAIGDAHGCAVVDDVIGCWGANGDGQVGFASSLTSQGVEQPGRVQNLSGTTISVAVGEDFSCAVVDGTAYCWGSNSSGQLAADATVTSSDVPLTVSQIGSGVLAIAAADEEACAVTSNGGVSCWGGDGDDPPTPVTGISGASQIAVGPLHKCALASGTVYCWGNNLSSQLGNNDADGVTPTPPTNLPTNITQLSIGGSHTCALTATGEVWCWGINQYGELGRDTDLAPGLPASIPAVAGAIAVAAGDGHSCAVSATHVLHCWGDDADGQLGDNTKDTTTTPVAVDWP